MHARDLTLLLFLTDCTRRTDYSSKPVATSAAPILSEAPPSSARPLQTHFGAAQLAKRECVVVEGTALRGTNCPSGIAVFGPYVPVPAGADVNYSFTITPFADADIAVDLVANTGKLIFAQMSTNLRKGQASRLLVRSRPQVDARTLEARIALVSPGKLSYTISDISLDVH